MKMVGKVKKKWQSLDANIQRIAKTLGAIAAIIGAVTGAGAWITSQMNAALDAHITAQTYDLKQEVKELTTTVEIQDKEQELQLMRLELMVLMEHDPDNTVEIEKLAHKYFSSGGNTYMSSVYAKYCRQHDVDCEIMYK